MFLQSRESLVHIRQERREGQAVLVHEVQGRMGDRYRQKDIRDDYAWQDGA